jgi:hypothetical protein
MIGGSTTQKAIDVGRDNAAGNITNTNSNIGTLFKFEQFDPPLLRDAVGRLVFGAYENELYANELRFRELHDEFKNVSSELAAISKLVGQTGQVLTPSWLEAEHKRIEEERTAIEAQISEVERAIYETGAKDSLSLESQRHAYTEVQQFQAEISKVTAAIDASKFEIADAAKFVSDLESKLASLNDSSATSDEHQNVQPAIPMRQSNCGGSAI